jgi:uroporphyrin-3 C-methyltransferase
MTDAPAPVAAPTTPAAAPRRRRLLKPLLAVLLLAVLALGGWRAWRAITGDVATHQAADAALDAGNTALAGRLDRLRDDLRAQSTRLAQAEATNRVLRDELLALAQRADLLEQSVTRLDRAPADAATRSRLQQLAWLLAEAQASALTDPSLAQARALEALAAEVLDADPDPRLLDLKQTLARERDALAAPAPRAAQAAELAALMAALPRLPQAAPANATDHSWAARAFARVVTVQPSAEGALVDPPARRAAALALATEASLARAALTAGDANAWHASLQAMAQWAARLWPDSPARRTLVQRIERLAATPPAPPPPLLGQSLAQLRQSPLFARGDTASKDSAR